MNNFNKRFGIAFYNSFRKVKSNCDQENMSILHTHSFQKEMLFTLARVLIYSLTKLVLKDGFKDNCVLRIL